MGEVQDRGTAARAAPSRAGNGRPGRLLKAFTHPLRVAILARLDEAVLSPKELAAELDVSLPVVSYHVRELERLKMIELVRTAQRRGAVQHWYRAKVKAPVAARDWRGMSVRSRREVVNVALARLEASVATAAEEGGFDHAEVQLHGETLELDERAFDELAAALSGVRERIVEITRAAEARMRSGNGRPMRGTLALMLFEGPYGASRRVRRRR